MKEIIIQVPENCVSAIEKFVEKIGGSITENSKEKRLLEKQNKRKEMELKPLDFFGTWPDIDLDPVTYRGKLWRKAPES